MLTITPIQTPIACTAAPGIPATQSADVGARRRRGAALLQRIGAALRHRPTPSEQVIDDLQGVDTLRRW